MHQHGSRVRLKRLLCELCAGSLAPTSFSSPPPLVPRFRRGVIKAAASIALEGIDGVDQIGGTFTDLSKVSELAGQVASDEYLLWIQEQAISTAKGLGPEEVTDHLIEEAFSKLTESKKGLLPQSTPSVSLLPVRVDASGV